MKVRCPRSCKVCSGSKSEMCVNMNDEKEDCQSRGIEGECKIRDGNKRRNMKTEYAKTCCQRGELYK